MNLHALKIYAKVAELGSVTRAAEQLRISQPAVTAQIRNLEKELELLLLTPKGRGIGLTDAGKLLASQAKRLFTLEIEIEARLDEYKLGQSGKLLIAATYLPANFLLPKWISQFKLQHEKVECILTTTNSREAFELLTHFEAELAIVGGGAIAHPSIEKELLFEDELWFVVPIQHRYADQTVTLEQIMKEPFILREEGSSTREKLFALCRTRNVDPPVVGLQFNGLNETIRAVIAGYGATFVSSLEVNEYVSRGEIAQVQVKDFDLRNPISLCRRTADPLSPAAENFRQWVRGYFYPAEFPKNR
ncbi:MAG: transcriptional regulator [Bacilli bacterium]|nr:transcriptional regulator [Bacilli bacterium]